MSITDGSEDVVLQPSKPATLLAALLLSPNAVVSTESLLRAVWGDVQPASAKTSLHACVLRLRRIFAGHGIAGTRIETIPGGYRIAADGRTLDLMRFNELMRAAGAARDPERELLTLSEALALWKGPVLANVHSDLLHRDEVPRISEEWLRATERRYDVELMLGRSRQVISELWRTTRSHPGHERFWEQLIGALYLAGRQMEALAEYRRVKGYLQEELGVAPGASLQRLELAVLRGEELDPGQARRRSAGPVEQVALSGGGRPQGFAPVPGPVPGFTGRQECAAIVAHLARDRPGTELVVISGAPGTGKTALALEVAALVREAFPGGSGIWPAGGDGRSAGAGGDHPLPPSAAPTAPVAAADNGRVLLILDDVVAAEQAQPLLRSAPRGAVIVTSRLSLASLVATHGGRVYRLQPLTEEHSFDLLATALGPERTEADAGAVRELAALCGHLPIALRIASARLLTRPRLRVGDFLQWLREDPYGRLAIAGDPGVSVAGMLAGALERLDPATAGAFLTVAAAGNDPLSTRTAGIALGLPDARAEELMERLVDVGLAEEGGPPGTYGLHDLLRRFGRELGTRPPAAPGDGPRRGPLSPTGTVPR
ncbi:BTAD domain-containing putative transcriptional regulator [Kitasatospora sp. NPDC048540]|uniref:AfsR/SARP family transcriptional regulator n=1 Tax=unclassified Kitasatospora TaxID=2633591 RepID=UPI0033F8B141